MHLTHRLLTHQLKEEKWILLNTLSGAADVVDRKGYESLQRMKEGDFFSVDKDFVDVLKKRAYLFESKSEEDELLRRMLEQNRKKIFNGPLKTVICPTYACNLRCTYCFQGELHEKIPISLSLEEITLLFQALDRIVKKNEAAGAEIQLFGGEPLLSSTQPLIEHILKLASERKYPLGIITNGVNLSKFTSLFRKYPGCVKIMQITVDGPAHIHNKRRKFVSGAGTFERIVKGIDFSLDSGIAVMMRVNVDMENVHFLLELADFIKEKGWNEKEIFRARLAKVETHGGEKNSLFLEYTLTEKIEKLKLNEPELKNIFSDMRISRTLGHLLKIIEKDYKSYEPNFYYCEASSTGIFVFGADGLLYPCSETAGNPSFVMGRFVPHLELNEEKFNLWRNQDVLKIPECRDCSIALLCGGGCRYEAMRVNEETRTQLCGIRKKQIEDYLKLHAQDFSLELQSS
ncbi:radical SAM protein [Candidatus Aerophobetes bacterium]|nr:radical SAM protein [Candidatus Aerophobetes bacterium]